MKNRTLLSVFIAGLMFVCATNVSAQAMYVSPTGDVGIGTDTPTGAVHVVRSTGNAGELFRMDNDGGSYISLLNRTTGSTWWFVHENFDGSPAGPRFLITHSAQSGPSMSLSPDGDMILAGSLWTAGSVIPDYVFQEDYDLMPINEFADFIKREKHLPRVTSNADVQKAGSINVSSMQLQLLEKVEELALYTIDQEEKIDDLKQNLRLLTDRLASLEKNQ